jgi:hypothetical protein
MLLHTAGEAQESAGHHSGKPHLKKQAESGQNCIRLHQIIRQSAWILDAI